MTFIRRHITDIFTFNAYFENYIPLVQHALSYRRNFLLEQKKLYAHR